MRVVLVRHGPSAHPQSSGTINRDAVLEWRIGYDAAGILPDSVPPPELIRIAADATHIIASDMPRAVASAQRLAPRREIRISPLFRETHLPIPRWPTPLPLFAWAMLIHAAWHFRILRGVDAPPSDRAQATRAAEWLSGVVPDGTSAVIVTHGVFRTVLARQLVGLGWSTVSRVGGFDHWSTWTLARTAQR